MVKLERSSPIMSVKCLKMSSPEVLRGRKRGKDFYHDRKLT